MTTFAEILVKHNNNEVETNDEIIKTLIEENSENIDATQATQEI